MRSYGLGQPYIHLYTRLWYIHLKGSGQLNVHGSGQPNVHGSWRWPSTQRYTTYSLLSVLISPSFPPPFFHQPHLIATQHSQLTSLTSNLATGIFEQAGMQTSSHCHTTLIAHVLHINLATGLFKRAGMQTSCHSIPTPNLYRTSLTSNLATGLFQPAGMQTSSHCHTTLIAHVPHIKPRHRTVRTSRNASRHAHRIL